MKVILISVILICYCTILGLAITKFLNLENNASNTEKNISKSQYWSIVPLLGAITLVCILQSITIFFTIQVIKYIMFGLMILLIFYIKEYIKWFFICIKDNKYICLIIGFSLFILNYPVAIKNQLISFQNTNNDIIYYLASMDWLQNHTILEPVTYTLEYPFYSLAEFMIKTTRFGTDLLGALFMAMFNLEAHEIFFILTSSLAIMSILAVYFFMSYGLKLSKRIILIATIVTAIGGNWAHLIASQYAPQIFGMGCLLTFTVFLIKLYEQKTKKLIFLTALFLIGTLTVYAEYAAYLLAIFIAIGIGNFCIDKEKRNIREYLPAVYAGLLSFVLNPFGMFTAIKFNLSILFKSLDSVSNIDPFSGKVLSLPDLVAKVLGMIEPTQLQQGLSARLDYSIDIVGYVYSATLILILIIGIIIVTNGMIKGTSKLKYTMTYIMTFFIGYTIYFHSIRYGYGEYKHITSMAPFIVVFIAYFINNYEIKNLWDKFIRGAVYASISIIIMFNLANLFINYRPENFFYFDDEVMELQEAIEIIPENEEIGVINSLAPIQHSIVYALKDTPIRLTGDDYSYFSLLLDIDYVSTKYMIREYYGDGKKDIFNPYDIIWHNSRFAITEYSEEIFSYAVDGFYDVEFDGQGGFRWTNNNESMLVIENISEEDKEILVTFDAGHGPTSEKHITIYHDEKEVAEGVSGTTIETKPIKIGGKEKIVLYLVSEEPLCKIPQDPREFGFSIRNFKVKAIGGEK